MDIAIRLLNANVNLDGKECSVTSVRISAILGVNCIFGKTKFYNFVPLTLDI